MAVRKFKPVTAGTRHKIIGTYEEITRTAPEKSLLSPKKSSGGRNNTGKMTVRYIGGGHKQMYRNVDFKRAKDGIAATVKSIEYDPNRTARIALLVYADGEKSYIIAPNGLKVGSTVMSGAEAAPEVGNALPLNKIPVGTLIHNIELRPGQGAMMARSAGTFAQLTSRDGDYAIIKYLDHEEKERFGVSICWDDTCNGLGEEFYVIPLNSQSIREQRFDDNFYEHQHIPLPLATLAKLDDLDENMRKNYLAFVEWLKLNRNK